MCFSILVILLHLSLQQVKKLEKKKQAVADKLGRMVNWSEEVS